MNLVYFLYKLKNENTDNFSLKVGLCARIFAHDSGIVNLYENEPLASAHEANFVSVEEDTEARFKGACILNKW